MSYIIAAFKTRNSTLKYFKMLKGSGIGVSVISTPKAVGGSCGISVKMPRSMYLTAKKLLSKTKLPGFEGFYLIKRDGAKLIVSRI